ncbi:MAG: hypothetical protein NC915_00295 [Candidatus Omnitrophica bacterium]|nr:hypothetical protein [Candidatus Omnitrophota bacterium]
MEIQSVWWDGYHKDIIRHKDIFFITFRHATKHAVEGKSEIYVIGSKGLKDGI